MTDRLKTVVRPLITEKSSAAYAERQEYAFVVDPRATKHDIREAIETLFDVRVKRVRTMVQRARWKSMGRYQGTRPAWKKALVTLYEGDSIEIFEG